MSLIMGYSSDFSRSSYRSSNIGLINRYNNNFSLMLSEYKIKTPAQIY